MFFLNFSLEMFYDFLLFENKHVCHVKQLTYLEVVKLFKKSYTIQNMLDETLCCIVSFGVQVQKPLSKWRRGTSRAWAARSGGGR